MKNSICKLGVQGIHRIISPGVVGVHAIGGVWALLSVGLFAKKDHLKSSTSIQKDIPGLIYVSNVVCIWQNRSLITYDCCYNKLELL